jgi:bifunctional non-homologous end joining protein LigD
MLAKLIAPSARRSPVQYSNHVVGSGPQYFAAACKIGLEGIISKRRSAPYKPGARGGDWVKTKCVQRQEFVVGGWKPSEIRGKTVASLLLGYYRMGKLIYAGHVGTGFTVKSEADMNARLLKVEQPACPFEKVPRSEAKGARWTKPALVVEIEFATWTADGYLRHPSFKGMRLDKKAGEVVREETTTS